MEYVNDINITEAILHILDNNAQEPILNEYKLELNEEVYKFIYKHIERAFKDEELKYAYFNPERNIVKEVSQEYLGGTNNDFVEVSKEIARQLFAVMNGNGNIPSCDLMVASISTDKGPMLGILKMDYVKNFTHKVDFVQNKIGINIIEQAAGLPASSQRIQKCAFIKPIMDGEIHLMVMDKQKKSQGEDEYGANYFINNFLGCTVVNNERDMTKNFVKATETWTRNNFTDDADKAEKVRTAIKTKLKNDEVVKVEELSQELFQEQPQHIAAFNDFIKSQGVDDEVTVDKQWIEKKLKRVRLKIDKDIDLYINEEAYHDSNRFEIQRNGDGSINLVVKHVINYVEK